MRQNAHVGGGFGQIQILAVRIDLQQVAVLGVRGPDSQHPVIPVVPQECDLGGVGIVEIECGDEYVTARDRSGRRRKVRERIRASISRETATCS
jgi:hypothetical protein